MAIDTIKAKKLEKMAKPGPTAEMSKAVQPADPFERFEVLYDLIARRAFELFENRGGSHGRELDDWLDAEAQFLRPIEIHVEESAKAVEVHASIDGFESKNVAIGIEGRRLTITGKRESTNEQRKHGGAI